jgi:hypothetical protein
MSKKKIAPPPPSGTERFFKKHFPLAVLLAVTALLYTGAGVLSGRLNLVDDYDYIVQYGHYDRPLNLAGLGATCRWSMPNKTVWIWPSPMPRGP